MLQIKSRFATGRAGNAKEYYVLVKTRTGGIMYNGWYTIMQITEFPECPVGPAALRNRINYANKGRQYKSFWELVTLEANDRGNNLADPDIEIATRPGWAEFVNVLTMWPHGSYAHTIR